MKRITPLRAIRRKCIECSGGNKREARLCGIVECELYPFRLGRGIGIGRGRGGGSMVRKP
jgi:hypothetical protein